jgi:hypothetical protein
MLNGNGNGNDTDTDPRCTKFSDSHWKITAKSALGEYSTLMFAEAEAAHYHDLFQIFEMLGLLPVGWHDAMSTWHFLPGENGMDGMMQNGNSARS